MKKQAIVSVYDKTGLAQFVKELANLGVNILSTGGTLKYLEDNQIKVDSIDTYTGSPEILGGRVKTLHPKVHGGILARRSNPKDLQELSELDIATVDFVVVNLYPFPDKIREMEEKGSVTADAQGHDSLVEFIDIGGPTMLRAAAKNFQDVAPVCDPADYSQIVKELKEEGKISLVTRRKLAGKVFKIMAAYDAAIARYFSLDEQVRDDKGNRIALAPFESIVLEKKQELRYGENPHQSAGLYRPVELGEVDRTETWQVLQGKELSYNNLLDLHGALDLFFELYQNRGAKVPAVVIKHANPSGAALADTAKQAYVAARDCDPVSAFGGIIVLSGKVDADLAQEITSLFVEVVALEEMTPEAQEVFAKKKNLRVVKCNYPKFLALRAKGSVSVRAYLGDYLLQTIDNHIQEVVLEQTVTELKPTPEMLAELNFAWKVCKHVKSNAIVLAKNLQAIGVGAGQMSRLDSAKIAVQRARTHGHEVQGSVVASDAFLPFPDTLEIVAEAGIKALVQPGGSIKDQDVIECANKLGIVMLFTNQRHFRH
ncbi:MAG: bifunctional phosphoribosylaminoimidazolecarboxamide formyltransferase/IMP cyclohydrolase [Proteobacteria bacterium]|nr:bifunctional phosphoribosylaminoimidazolecarboxamide formyltransferase/IMP cyclohydrolase [Pseudomonadota bacterium]